MSTPQLHPGLGGAWWRLMARLGLPESRWQALPAWQQMNLARSLGTLLGLPGPLALLPLILFVAAATWFAFHQLRAAPSTAATTPVLDVQRV